jgi:hypothetical protein
MGRTMLSGKSSRRRRWLLATGTALALVLLILCWPESDSLSFGESRGEPFAWRQDAYWSELERQFVAARAAGCIALTRRIDAALIEANRLLGELESKHLPPGHPAFGALETNLFQLGPLMAACPERLEDLLSLGTRIRATVKRQSQHWDGNPSAERQQLYRSVFGARMALEEVMLQAPAAAEFPTVVRGEDEPSRPPAATILGVTVHSGDILLSRGGAPTSALIARGNDFAGSFSHVALVHVDERTGRASVVESHIERGVAVASFDEYLQEKKLRVLVLRPRADLPALRADPMLPHKAAARALEDAQRRHIPYDFAMDWRDHQAQFCSEVVAAAYELSGVRLWMYLSHISSPTLRLWLASLGVRHFETQLPADLEYDPQLRVVAEWRDRATLFKAHIDDAVIDVMLEEAEPGKALSYSRSSLPVARLAKAWSVLLNAFGKEGPIPEGMSATTALRVRQYRADHAAIAGRLRLLADEFKRRQSYAPPYWELVRLARQAKHDVDRQE